VVQPAVLQHEYRLRVGQASEALHEIRRLLLVHTHLYKLKDRHSRGVRANMRSGDKITALNEQVKRAAAQYRAARRALEPLGRVLRRDEWSWTLLELWENDIRGLPQAQFHNPECKQKKQKRARTKKTPPRPLSWIWVTRGERWEAGDDAAMNEGTASCGKRRNWLRQLTNSCTHRMGQDASAGDALGGGSGPFGGGNAMHPPVLTVVHGLVDGEGRPARTS
jgi:hypothetical protein